MLVSHGTGTALSFLHTDYGITFLEAPESIIQLCTLRLQISNVSKKGGVEESDFLPMDEALTEDFVGLSLELAELF